VSVLADARDARHRALDGAVGVDDSPVVSKRINSNRLEFEGSAPCDEIFSDVATDFPWISRGSRRADRATSAPVTLYEPGDA
jgi:hypothetical protein